MKITYGSVCSGIEAASVAWEPIGFQPAWFSQFDPEHNYKRGPDFPSAVLAHHWPHVPNVGDMTKLAEQVANDNIPAPSILVGGTPCQAFSVAGARKGLSDERGQLTISYGELADAIDQKRTERGEKPAIFVWENVKGVLSSKDNAFGSLLGLLSGEDCELVPPGKKWTNAGYVSGPKRTVAWRVYDAQNFGLQQQRLRVFLVATARTDINPGIVLPEYKSVRGDIESFIKGFSSLPVPVDGGTLCRFRRTDSYIADTVSSTLTARDNKGPRDLVVTPDGRVRGLIPEEYEILQGFPVGHTNISGATPGKRIKALGNSMAVPCMAWIGQRIAAQLMQHANDNQPSSNKATA